MEIKYGVTGKDRKVLVMAIAEIIGVDAIYKGVPTCSYEVDYFTIDKSGTFFFEFARHGRALTGASPEHAQIVGSV